LLEELDQMVKKSEQREQLLLQKMCLIVNAKKLKIKELKMEIAGGAGERPKVQSVERKKVDELEELMKVEKPKVVVEN
jgi:2C-methyl-D-erythritol 2,4-cyclodiphosphate synthase